MTTSNRRRSKENAQVGDETMPPKKCATTMWRPNYAALKQAALRRPQSTKRNSKSPKHQNEQQKSKTINTHGRRKERAKEKWPKQFGTDGRHAELRNWNGAQASRGHGLVGHIELHM